MRKEWLWRGGIYLSGMMIIAVGITLSTKSGLGIAPMTSAPYALAASLQVSFSNTVFFVYVGMVFIQWLIQGKNRTWKVFLQIPSSLVFTSFLRWFEQLMPLSCENLWQKLLTAAAGSILIGIGFAMMVDMQLIPNPPDGLIFVTSEATKKDLGLWKNIFDMTFVILAGMIDWFSCGHLRSIGLGTMIAMVLTGRVVALTNRLWKEKMLRKAGMHSAGS